MLLQSGDRGVAERGKGAVYPNAGIRGVPRVAISTLRYQRARIEEADERDYAAARPGEHECTRTVALRAHCTKDRARSCSPATL